MSSWSPPPRPVRQLLREALPLLIRGTEVTDPVVTLFGDGWGLTMWCDWTVDALELGSSSPDLEDRVWDLVGTSIVGVEARAGVGPVFALSAGHELALVEGDDDEPWVMHLPGLILTEGIRGASWG